MISVPLWFGSVSPLEVISFLDQCFEDQFDSPSAWVRDVFLLQGSALDIRTPARLCLDIFGLFCCGRCSADRFS